MPSAAVQSAASQTLQRSSDLFATPGKRTVVLALALFLLTIIVYSAIGKNAFINFDDTYYITENPHVKSGLHWETVKWAFTSYHAANWHPLTWLSHALDCQLFGLNPAGHHFMNVLLHGLNVVLLFLFLQSMTGFTWRSLFIAGLFAVHPLAVESVAWAAERKNVLSMFFFLLAMCAYVSYARQPRRWRYLTVTILFALALMSKPQVITFPFVLLLLDYWPLRRVRFGNLEASSAAKSPASLLLEKIPFFIFSALSAVVTMHAQRAGEAVRTVNEYPPLARAETAIFSYALYLRDIIFPLHLAPIYPHPVNSLCMNCGLEWWKIAISVALLVVISVLCVVLRQRRYLAVGWLWFIGTLVPMIGIVQVGTQGRADRYLYLPVIGIFVAIVWGVSEVLKSRAAPRALIVLACGLILTVLSAITYRQIASWRNSETLWNYTLRVTDRNFMAEDNLAQELAHQGRTLEAMVHFHNTLNLYNWGPSDLITFGVYEQRHGYPTDAIKQYERALRNTTDASTRALEFSNMGSAYMDLKDIDHAEGSFEQALQADPKNVAALIGTGLIAHKRGNLNLAIHQYSAAISVKPSDLAYTLLGRAFEQSGRASDATNAYNMASALSSDFQSTRAAVDQLLNE